MKIAVCVKQVDELPGHIEFASDGRSVKPDFIEHQMNEPDTYAVEEALLGRDRLGAEEISVVTVGSEQADDVLRKSLAMGADRAERLIDDGVQLRDPVAVARALADAEVVRNCDLVLCGVQSSDAAQQATGPALAAFLGRPCIFSARRTELVDGALRVHRELAGGVIEIVDVDLPAVVTIQTGANEPRYGNFKDVMRSKKAPIVITAPTPAMSRVELLRVRAEEANGDGATLIDGGPAEVAAWLVGLLTETT